jgi:hypothetical protein
MTIYHYHPTYKYYTGSSQADESPLEPGVYLIPAHATDIVPPNCAPTEIQVLKDNQWAIYDNKIGTYYKIETREEFFNEDPINVPTGYTKEIPPEPQEGYIIKYENLVWQQVPDLDLMKTAKLRQVENDWQETVKQGWTTPYGWSLGISSEDVSLLSANFLLAKEAASIGITDLIFVIDTEGESHEFNLQDLTMLMLQYGQARAILSSQDAAKRKMIKNSASIEELNQL